MKIIAIIQARMGSTRLPGKVLKKILGKPMLQLELERISRAKTLNQIVVATSRQPIDAQIARLASKLGFLVYRGSETDVLSRYYRAAKKFSADTIVRLTGDCPLIDPIIIDQAISKFKTENCDYVANVHVRSFPRGMDIEVFSFIALQTAWQQTVTPYDREHVTPYIYAHPRLFKLKEIIAPKALYRPELRLTVDEAPDFKLVKSIYQELYASKPHFKLQDIITCIDQHPELKTINQSVVSKPSPYQRLV